MAKWINRTLVQAPANGTTTLTVNFTAASAGNLLVAIAESSATPATPSGWAQPTNGSAVNFAATKLWTKTATAGESSFSTVLDTSNYSAGFVVYEFPAGSTVGTVASATSVASAGGASPSLTGLTGTNLLIAVLGQLMYANVTTNTVTWGGASGIVKDTDVFVVSGGTGAGGHDGYELSVAYLEDSTATSFAPTATTAAGDTAGTERISFVVRVANNNFSGSAALSGSGSLSLSGSTPTAKSGTFAGTATGTLTVAAIPHASASLSLSASGTLGIVSNPMAAWQAAVASRGGTAATAMFVGDSLTEGQGASSKATRWLDILAGHWRTDYPTAGVVGGAGYLPAWYAVYAPDAPWPYTNAARTGTIADVPQNEGDVTDKSLGLRSEQMSPGATLTFTITGTSFDLWWVQGYGSFTYKIDSGLAVTVNTAGGTTGNAARTAGVSLGGGTHTVTITATTAVRFSGLMVYNGDETSGVRVVDAAHVGFDTGAYLGMGSVWSLVQPDFVMIELGANDFTFARYTSAQVKANLKQLIAEIRAAVAKPLSIGVVIFQGTLSSGSNPEPWSNYIAAITAVTTEDASVKLFNWGTLGPFASDGAHPNDTGQQNIEATVRSQLAVPTTIASGSAGLSGSGSLSFTVPIIGNGILRLTATGSLTATGVNPNARLIFRTPIVQRRVPVIPPVMALINYSLAVLRIGGQWIETDHPSEEQIDAADYYFPGGYEIPVDAATAAVLTAAGYTVDTEN